MMTNNSPSNEKALKIAQDSQMVDSKIISQLFKNMKKKGILDKPIEIKIEKEMSL